MCLYLRADLRSAVKLNFFYTTKGLGMDLAHTSHGFNFPSFNLKILVAVDWCRGCSQWAVGSEGQAKGRLEAEVGTGAKLRKLLLTL